MNVQRRCATLQDIRTPTNRKRPGMLTRGVIVSLKSARPHVPRTVQDTLLPMRWKVLNPIHPRPFT